MRYNTIGQAIKALEDDRRYDDEDKESYIYKENVYFYISTDKKYDKPENWKILQIKNSDNYIRKMKQIDRKNKLQKVSYQNKQI